jgi:ABC-type Fe3+/spermidine/putrescine transport system ATPase subunit
MADRIAVLKDGSLRQVGTPHEIYESPKDRFVAQFIGVMNFFDGKAVDQGVQVNDATQFAGSLPSNLPTGTAVTLAVRPERLILQAEPSSDIRNQLDGEIVGIAYHGLDVTLSIKTLVSEQPVMIRIPANSNNKLDINQGSHVHIGWQPEHSLILVDTK